MTLQDEIYMIHAEIGDDNLWDQLTSDYIQGYILRYVLFEIHARTALRVQRTL